jgi:hypothetical protein
MKCCADHECLLRRAAPQHFEVVANGGNGPFTCDETQGMPVSPAACFCVNAFAVLSPQTPATRVLSAMKGAIHTQAETFLEISQNDV